MTQVAIQSQEQDEAHAEPIVIIRPSFKKICDGEPCRAALFNHILYWIAKKRKQGIDYWYSTGDGLYHDLAESWGVTQVRREVNKLINSNLVGVMKNPRMGIDRTKHFIFHAAQATIFFAKCAAEKICYCCIGLAREVINLLNAHLIDLLNAQSKDEAIDKSVKCLCAQHQEHLIELSKPFDSSITAITQVSYSGEESVTSSESLSESNISVTHVTDAAPFRPYEQGHPAIEITRDDLEALTARLMEDVYRNQPAKISTPVIPSVDTESHIVKATGNEAAPPTTEQPHALQDALPQSATSPPAKETRARGKSKNALTLQGQHILDEYQQFKGRKSTPGKATIEAANGLVDLVANDEEFLSVLTEIRDDKFLNDHNVARDLDFVYRKYEQYRDIVEQKIARKQAHSGSSKLGISGLPRDVPLTDKPLPVILHRNQPRRGYA